MTSIAANRTLALVLLHFLWQGALAAIFLAAVNSVLSRSRARARYMAACATLVLMLAMPAATGLWLGRRGTVSPAASVSESSISSASASAVPRSRASDPLGRYSPWIVLLWFAGAGILSLRAAGGWIVATRLTRRDVRPAPPEWEERLRALAGRLSVRTPVRLLESLRVQVPSAIGTLRPVILLPASIATGLTAHQLDAILAHELAHVRRRDFLVNLLQIAAETLLFYHPAVWWVSARIRIERENACDDLAVAATRDAAAYARTLIALEERRTAETPRLAVAFSGSGRGRLAERVTRLFPSAQPSRASVPRPLGAVAIAALGAAVVIGSTAAVPSPATSGTQTAPPAPTAEPAPAVTPKPARAPAKSSASTSPSTRSSSSRRANGGLLTPDQLVAFRIHGVTPEFIDEIEALGFTKLSPDDLVALRIHDVSSAEIRQMKELFGAISLDECVAFKIHGVTPELVREYKSLGLGELSPDEAVAFRIHGVTPAYVREIRGLGYDAINADDLVAFRIHGVTPDYIRKMNQSADGRLSADDLIETRIHGKDDEEEKP